MTFRYIAAPLAASGVLCFALSYAPRAQAQAPAGSPQAAPPPPVGPVQGTTLPPAPNQAPPQAAEPAAPVPTEVAPSPAGGYVPPQQAPQPEPTIYVAQPPLPPLYERTRMRHDGFYLRLNGGFGYGSTTSSFDGSSAEHRAFGATSGLDLLIGGTPSPGLVVGGGLFLQGYINAGSSGASNPALTRGTDNPGTVMLGPIIDVFPNPYGGFHFGGTLAFAGTSYKGDNDKVSSGFGLGIWAGYMGWVSSEWSLGGLVKFTGIWTGRRGLSGDEELDVNDASRSVQFMLSAAYH